MEALARDYMSSGSVDLSDGAIRVYGQIAAGEIPAECDKEFVDELVMWGFVTVDSNHGRPVALHPGEVARRRLEDMLQEAADRVARMAALPTVSEQLTVQYERARWSAGHGSEFLDDPAVVNARLDDVVGSAQREILAAQPGPRKPTVLAEGLRRDSAALDRGVELRTLYQATARKDPQTAEHVRVLSTREGRRAEYRTLDGPFERAIVVDRRVAFISNHLVPGAPEHAGWQITDRAVVAYIAEEFEAKWRRADPWQGTGSGPVNEVTTRRQREIMREIVEGRGQSAIAKRLDLSLRTVTAEITELKRVLGASSLPGLAYKWASCPDRKIDDRAPEDSGDATA
ncbi:helix-turn-helix transcriptional regulator [Streptomyces mexicanus]|uniref:helix-turn-helix transcriptional regulator n=1 Tax=Streptomyces mexicanus TaxID=178566 RepID=UPI003657519B